MMYENNRSQLSRSEDRIINLLFATSILSFFHLSAISLSLPVGLWALHSFQHKVKFRLFSIPVVFLTMLMLVGFVSALVSPVDFRIETVVFLLQFVYWLLLLYIVGTLYPYINKRKLAKYIAVSTMVAGCANVFADLGTQNGIAFAVVTLGPLGVYGFKKNRYKILYSVFIVGLMLFNSSRSGLAILSVSLVVANMYMMKDAFKQRAKTIVLTVGLALAFFLNYQPMRNYVGWAVMPYNEEMGLMLVNPDLVLMYDKSWVQRKVQVQKGLQIFEKHPVIGVGASNFRRMPVSIRYGEIENVDYNVLMTTLKRSSNRSAHNSYISLISEYGAVGTLMFALFMLYNLVPAFIKLDECEDFDAIVVFAAVGMLVYFYTITGLYGTLAWVFFGLIMGVGQNVRRRRNR